MAVRTWRHSVDDAETTLRSILAQVPIRQPQWIDLMMAEKKLEQARADIDCAILMLNNLPSVIEAKKNVQLTSTSIKGCHNLEPKR